MEEQTPRHSVGAVVHQLDELKRKMISFQIKCLHPHPFIFCLSNSHSQSQTISNLFSTELNQKSKVKNQNSKLVLI